MDRHEQAERDFEDFWETERKKQYWFNKYEWKVIKDIARRAWFTSILKQIGR